MIDLLTGLPGNAKTLFGLELWIARATAENRPVYYSGLNEFIKDDPRLNGTTWIELDPVKWHEDVPPNSLIFIDEGQETFRNRSIGANPPKHVTELEKHRHKGLDFLIITQHPSLIDPAIRRLTQTHRHMIRMFGMEMSTVHKWNGTKDNCDKSRADSEKSKWAFNKKLYGLYKSADSHTMKRKLPGRVKMLLALPFVLAALIWFVYSIIVKKTVAPPGPQVGRSSVATLSGVAGQAGVQPPKFDPVADALSYVNQNTPRVVGLPHTAPKYDEITKPVRAPVPALCIQRADTCKCTTQQGTPMDVAFNMCISFARNGWFEDFDPEGKSSQPGPASSSAPAVAGQPAPVAVPGGGAVLVIADSTPPSTPAKYAITK